jgi:hypothetical protein
LRTAESRAGVGVFEAVFAGEFEGSVDGAETAGGEVEGLGAATPEFDRGGGWGRRSRGSRGTLKIANRNRR